MLSSTGDRAADAYLLELAARARALLRDELLGTYLVGSAARGDYLPGRSDLDVALVSRTPLDIDAKAGLVDALRADALPVPATKLELVAYRADVARSPGARPPFELNVNTGAGMPDRVSLDPADEPWFWFALDLAAAADAAGVIEGAPAGSVFGPMPRPAVIEALRVSRAWHASQESEAVNRVLNGCRAWCWLATGRWRSKSAAARWAIDVGADAELVEHALALRAGARSDLLDPHRVDAFDRAVGDRIGSASA